MRFEDICNGIFLHEGIIGPHKDRIVSYGELLSSRIIAAALQSEQMIRIG